MALRLRSVSKSCKSATSRTVSVAELCFHLRYRLSSAEICVKIRDSAKNFPLLFLLFFPYLCLSKLTTTPMKLHFFAFLMLCACLSYGQNATTTGYKYALKAYNSFYFSNGNPPFSPLYGYTWLNSRDYPLLHPSIALMWKGKNRISHEVELANFVWQKRDDLRIDSPFVGTHLNHQSHFALAFRYEYMYRIGKETWRFSPIIGAGIAPYVQQHKTQFYTSASYPTNTFATGAKVYVTPRLNVRLTNRWFLDINVPITLFEPSLLKFVIQNPSLPLRQQNNSYFNFTGFSTISARVAVGVRL